MKYQLVISSKYSLTCAQVARDIYYLVYATLHSGTSHLPSGSFCNQDEARQDHPHFTDGESGAKQRSTYDTRRYNYGRRHLTKKTRMLPAVSSGLLLAVYKLVFKLLWASVH